MNKLIHSVLCLIMLASCGPKESSPATESASSASGDTLVLSKEQTTVAGIELGQIQLRSLGETIAVTGVLDVPPQNLVNITAPLGGFLRSTSLLQGMRVTKGQVIAVIENPEYIQLQQDFLDTKSQVGFLSAEYERQKHLASENVSAQKTLQKALADLNSMKARNSGLLSKLRMLSIDPEKLTPESIGSTISLRTPINGYVTQVHSAIGAFVTPTDVMFKIVDTEHLHAELICFERDIQKVKIGQKIRFTLAHETKERTATVFLIGREISADRTVRIHGHLDREDRELIPGMYLKALIETGASRVPSLPEDAIIHFEDRQVIIVQVSEGSYTLVEVSTGIHDNGFVEVITPPDFDRNKTQVVLKNAYKLLSKMKNTDEEE